MTPVTRERPGPRPVAFSTVGLPDDERVERWESHNAAALIGLRCRTLSGERLEATELNLQVGRVHLARVRGTAHVVERDVALVRHRPADAVALFFSLAGEAFFYDDDGVRTASPGQLLVCDADRPFLRGFSGGLEELVLKVPRAVYAGATGIEAVPRPVVVDLATDAVAQALAGLVGRAARTEDPAAVDERSLLELVAALTTRRREDLGAARRAAAHAFIERHLCDPGLGAAQVAAAVGISTRQLSRLFAETGESLPQHVLARRLETAHRLLEEPGPSSVAEVARRCGFASPAHFSGAFTRRYGERAVEVRRRAAAARAAGRD